MADAVICCDCCRSAAELDCRFADGPCMRLCGPCLDGLVEGEGGLVLLEARPLGRAACPFCGAAAAAVLGSYGASCECGVAPPLPFTPAELRLLSPAEDSTKPF